jgi:hypothetical protein
MVPKKDRDVSYAALQLPFVVGHDAQLWQYTKHDQVQCKSSSGTQATTIRILFTSGHGQRIKS